jgi:succinyl-diaminopimelate desuccinylase
MGDRRPRIEVDAIIGDLCELIRCAAIDPGRVHRAMRYARSVLARFKIRSRIIKTARGPVLVAEVGPADARLVTWLGHLDVVPAQAPAQYEPRVRDGTVSGRGAWDMLGASVCMMHALSHAGALDAHVRLVLVGDEEKAATHSIVEFARRYGMGEFVIAGEPTNLRIGCHAKGVLAFELTVLGRSAHSSRPFEGENPILTISDVWRHICHLPFAQDRSPWFDYPAALAPTIATAGDVINTIPDVCRWKGTIRFLPSQRPESIVEQIRQLRGLPGVPDFTFEPMFVVPGLALPPEHPYVHALLRAVAPYHADAKILVGQEGTSDIAFIDTDGCECGPRGGDAHQPTEWVSIQGLLEYCDVLLDFSSRTAAL